MTTSPALPALPHLALSGSAAQSKIQSYPGDADYFERVHITADARDDACRILRDLMRDKALFDDTMKKTDAFLNSLGLLP